MNRSKAFTPAPDFLSALVGVDEVSMDELERRALKISEDPNAIRSGFSSYSLTYLRNLGWMKSKGKGIMCVHSITSAGVQARALLTDEEILETVTTAYNKRRKKGEFPSIKV
jgi:hypothetical protein